MNVSITPWKRFGHDRLYVSLDGRQLGYRDNATGIDHAEDPVDAALLAELVEAHVRDVAGSIAGPAPPAQSSDSSLTGQEEALVATSPGSVVAREPSQTVPVHQPDLQPAAEPATGEPAIDATASVPEWTDLAGVRPGQLARERAEEEWEARKAAYPIRSRLGRLLNVHTDERAWRIGADGEEAVGEQLEKLSKKDPRWHVLHSVPVGERGSDIDHVVLGPPGVFTINAKHHPGAKVWVGKDRLRVNGHTQPYIRNSRFEAKRASRTLTEATGFEVPVDALIVMWGVEDITVRTEPGEKDGSTVHVKYRRQAVRWLGKQPARLTDEQVHAVFEQARRSTAWVSPS